MTSNNLSVEGEMRYIVQWFEEWSELQREDFLPIMAEYLVKGSTGIYMNGIVSGLAGASCADKPMSLFQCRVKLFREWSTKWPEDIKEKLKERITEVDAEFAEKLDIEMSSSRLMNGNAASTPTDLVNISNVNEAIVA